MYTRSLFSRIKDAFLASDFYQVFNFRTPESKGSCLLLIHTLIANLLNVFITGVFYTAFLAQNGIDIVRVGIIAFIPQLSWFLSLFSPMLLRRFKRRRWALFLNHSFYYVCVVLATTVMPNFVQDPLLRTVWFGVFLFLGNACNALFGAGTMAWHIHFIPEGPKRNVYFSFQNLTGSLISTATAIISAFIADSMGGGAREAALIVGLRYAAFICFILDGMMLYLIPKEYPYVFTGDGFKIQDLIRLPLQHKKFLLCCIICFYWNFIANTNAATWSYFLLDIVEMPYLMTLIASVTCVLGNLFLLPFWRRLIDKYGWHKMLMVCFALISIQEITYSFTSKSTLWVYVVTSIFSGFFSSGLNLTYANLFYINLPKGDRDVYHVFWNLGANILAFLGTSFGAWFLAQFQPIEPLTIAGIPFYGSQFMPWVRFVLTSLLCLMIYKFTPYTQPDEELY